jgi:hypothetical protein
MAYDLLNSMMRWGSPGTGSFTNDIPSMPVTGTGLGSFGLMPKPIAMAAPEGLDLSRGDVQLPATTDYTGQDPIVNAAAMSTVTPGGGGSILDQFKSLPWLTTKDSSGVTTQGWGGIGLGAVQGLSNAFMGMQQYNLAKQQLEEGKRQYDQNYSAQRSTTNAQLEDRQRARVAANPGAYQSVGDYMNQYGVK